MTPSNAPATAEEANFEYHPLPPYGTPEFAAEIARRMTTPCRMYTVEEGMAELDARIEARLAHA